MKILVVCQHYWPEPFNTAEVCETLVERGHRVTVLTGMPNTGMPNNEIPSEYIEKALMEEERNGVRILRVKLHPRRTGATNRIKNYLSFWRNGNKKALDLQDDYDVVLGYQFSPVIQVDPGLKFAKKYHKKMLLYCFDLWPASLLAGGFDEGSLPFKWMRFVSKKIYKQADRIAVTSPLFDRYFEEELQLDLPSSIYLPQYAEDAFLGECAPIKDFFDSAKINLTFAGNVGQAQSVITIVEAAAILRNNERITFHIVGAGSRLEDCQNRAKELGLTNIVFHGRRPFEEMPAYYAASDAMLVTFEASPMAKYTLPRKVTTYLAAGKPILAALNGETERVINAARCGASCSIEDSEGLASLAIAFAEKKDARELGANARRYYEVHFTKNRFYETLERSLNELIEEKSNESK